MFTLGYRWEWEWQGVLRSRGEVAVALPLEAGLVEEPRQCGGHSCRQDVFPLQDSHSQCGGLLWARH